MQCCSRNGRHLSTWIIIVPQKDPTGGKLIQKGFFKKGDRFLLSLLIAGAIAVVSQAKIRREKYPKVTKPLGRMPVKQAAIAIANKTARIAWTIMVHGGVQEVGHRAAQYRGGVAAG
jgi:transposase